MNELNAYYISMIFVLFFLGVSKHPKSRYSKKGNSQIHEPKEPSSQLEYLTCKSFLNTPFYDGEEKEGRTNLDR
jgi:hypothetical protein